MREIETCKAARKDMRPQPFPQRQTRFARLRQVALERPQQPQRLATALQLEQKRRRCDSPPQRLVRSVAVQARNIPTRLRLKMTETLPLQRPAPPPIRALPLRTATYTRERIKETADA